MKIDPARDRDRLEAHRERYREAERADARAERGGWLVAFERYHLSNPDQRELDLK